MTNQKATILHVDINSYFATLLQQENPKLRGKPLGILKDVGRTCIIAASKEAKLAGVKTGSRLPEARALCPKIITLPAAFDRYLDATRRLKHIFASFSPNYSIYSLDEAFIDITECRTHLYPDPEQLGQTIQKAIFDELGNWVTCNVGISYNKLLAKLASEVSPKGSITTITEDTRDLYLADAAFSDVCGIGHRLEKKLRRIGVTTPYQIRFYTPAELEPLVGPFWAHELLRIAYGEDSHNLTLTQRTLPHMKSVGRSITGFKLYDDEDEIKRIIINLIEEISYKVRKMNLAGRYVAISLYGRDHQSWHRHQTLKHYIRHTSEIYQLTYQELYGSWQRNFKIIKFGIRLGMLKPFDQINPSLLPTWHKQEAVSRAIDTISNRYGLFTLRPGSLLNQPIIRPEVTGFFGDKQYYFE